jgi:FMN phosphatase YigB (HAD superfamily)
MNHKSETITTVLLDAGGVILDEREIEDFFASIITGLIAGYVTGYDINRYRSDVDEAVEIFTPTVYKYILWKNLKFDREIHDRTLNEFMSKFKYERPMLKLMAGIGEEIKAISENFDIAIAGQYGREILALLEKENLLGYFTHHITQDDFELTKPDPRYYEAIVRKIGVDPTACVMVHRNQIPRTPFEIPDADLPGINGLAKAIMELL